VAKGPAKREWTSLGDALRTFVRSTDTQSARHIKPLHWYVGCRLVIEGGFHPDDITPRPPFQVRSRKGLPVLAHDAESGGSGERTVLGGLKTKDVDVVVTKDGVGPVLAVSMKGTLRAFRNLTNRMEEAVGDCTNLHIAYPALVYGFLQTIRAKREGSGVPRDDVAIDQSGAVVEALRRYHDVLARLADRGDVRAETTKYEAVCLVLVSCAEPSEGEIIAAFPEEGSPLNFGGSFDKLYRQYDQRFVYAAPGLGRTTRRVEWHPDSPALHDPRIRGYSPRIAAED